jgi:transcriptional regulator with XRE-family HTH domain
VSGVARHVGDLIAEARSLAKGQGRRRGMSQLTLAKRMGIGPSGRSWIAQVENGITKKPDPARLRLIADILPTLDFREMLALTDQLDYLTAGESPAPEPQPAQPADLGALLVSQQALIDRLTTQNDLLRQLLELHLPKRGAADPTDIVGADKARQHPLPLAPDEPLPAPEDAAQDR